jgi:hypothetical protein
MGRDKHSGIAGHRRRNRIAGQFTALLTEMLESPAWCALSLSGRRILDRVAIELRAHGGYVKEGLCVTYDDFEAYGIHRRCIAPAIREAVALGFLLIKRAGRAGNAEFRQATLYEPTYLNMIDSEPTHDWRWIKTIEAAQIAARAARASERPEKQKPSGGIRTKTSGGIRTTNPVFHSTESTTTDSTESATTSESLGEQAQQRRSHRHPPARQPPPSPTGSTPNAPTAPDAMTNGDATATKH